MENLLVLFFRSIAMLVEAEHAWASVIFTSFIDVPSAVFVESKYLN